MGFFGPELSIANGILYFFVTLACSVAEKCQKPGGAGFWEEGQRWLWKDKELLMECKDGAPTPIQCIKESGETIIIGRQYTDGHLEKKCTSRGSHVLYCVKDGKRVGQLRFVDTNGVVRECSRRGVAKVGCKYQDEQKKFGEYFVVNGVRRQCTEDGLTAMECRDKSGAKLELGQTTTDPSTGLRFECTENGLEAKACSENDVDVAVGSDYMDPRTKMVKRCSGNGFEPAQCSWKSRKFPISQQFISDHGVSLQAKNQLPSTVNHRCTETGVVVDSCLYKGAMIPDGTTSVQENGLTVKCDGEKGVIGLHCKSSEQKNRGTMDYDSKVVDSHRIAWECFEHGLRKLGCSTVSVITGTSIQTFNAVYADEGRKWKCTEDNGPVPYGCTGEDGKSYNIGEQVSFGQFHFRCGEDGSFKKQGCLYSDVHGATHEKIVIPLAKTHQDGTLTITCDDHSGTVSTGCNYKGRQYNIDEGINDGALHYKCTSNGAQKDGCIYRGTVVTFGHDTVDANGLVIGCKKDGTTPAKGCQAKSGQVVAFGERLQKGGVLKKCERVNGWKEVTCQSSLPGGPIKVGASVVNNNGIRKQCTESGQLQPVSCIRNGQEKNIGELLDETNARGKPVWHCTETGFEPHGCRKENGDLVELGGPLYIEAGVEKLCERSGNGAKTVACLLTDGSRLALHDRRVINGLQLVCNENGLGNLGCPQMAGKPNVPVQDTTGSSSSFFDVDGMRFHCTNQGAVPVQCQWVNGEWKPLMSQVDDELGVRRICSKKGWKPMGCPDEHGTLAPIGGVFEKDGFRKICTENAAEIIGCFYKKEYVALGMTANHNGLEIKCTSEGIHKLGCRSPSGLQHEDSEYKERGLLKRCTADGEITLGCPTNSVPQKIGSRYQYNGVTFECTDNGAVSRSCKWQSGEKQIGHKFVVDGVARKCTDSGMVVEGCPDDNGHMAHLNTTFTFHGLRKRCTEGGAETGACLMEDGTQLKVGSSKVDARGIDVECTADGLHTLGCPAPGSNVIPIGTAYFGVDGIVQRMCTDQGPQSIGCRSDSNEVVATNDDVIQGGLKLHCSSNGWERVGCVTSANKRDEVFGLGTSFHDDQWSYNCTEIGAKVIGCVSNGGVVRANQEIFTEQGMKKHCDSDSGIEQLSCIVDGGSEVAVGQNLDVESAEDNSICKRCTSVGMVFKGCLVPSNKTWTTQKKTELLCSKRFSLPEGETVTIENKPGEELLKICTKDGLRTSGCYHEGKPYTIGEVLKYFPVSHSYGHRLQCTASGMEKLGCFSSRSSASQQWMTEYNVGDTFENGQQLLKCGPKTDELVGCVYKGMHYAPGDSFDDGSFRIKCSSESEIKKESCLYKGIIIAMGQSATVSDQVVKCDQQRGPYPTGCVFYGQNYILDETIDHGEFRYHCTDGGVKRVGCHYKTTVIAEGLTYNDNGLQVTCGDYGAIANDCKTVEGQIVVIGNKAKIGDIWNRCDRLDGWTEITCNSTLHRLPLKVKETVVIDGVRIKCTKNETLKPVGCVREGGVERKLGENLFDATHGLNWYCGQSGFTKRGCRETEKSELVQFSAVIEEHGLRRLCSEQGLQTQSCDLKEQGQNTLQRGESVVLNGLKKVCAENGIQNLGCPSGTQADQQLIPIGNNYEESYVKRLKCTEQGAIYTDCKWIDGQWMPIGATADRMGVTMKCSNDSTWNPVGCPNGRERLLSISDLFDSDGFKKRCTAEAVIIEGCYYRSIKNYITVGQLGNVNGLQVKCTTEGAHVIGCPSQGGLRLLSSDLEENGVVKRCTADGVVTVGCPSSNGPQAIGTQFSDRGMSYECSEAGAVPTGCQWQHGLKPIGETFVVDGVSRKCTPTGIEILGCPGDNGRMAALNSDFKSNGLKKRCADGGAQTGGCYMADGSLLKLGDKRVDKRDLEVICKEAGLNVLGCPSAQGQTVDIGAHYLDQKGIVLFNCAPTGPKATGCLTAEQDLTPLNEAGYNSAGDLKMLCTETGWRFLGCALDYEGDDEQLVDIGQKFQDDGEGFAYECTDGGVKKVGCVSKDQVHQFRDVFTEQSLKKQCSAENGIEHLGCIIDGTEVPMDGSYELENGKDRSLCQKCSSSGILLTGCILHTGRSWQMSNGAQNQHLVCKAQERVDVGDKIVEDRLLKVCTADGLSALKCIVNGVNVEFGYSDVQEDGVSMVCSPEGVVERRYKIPIRYLSKLERQFSPGQTLTVKGLATGDTFTINLLAGSNYGADNCVLHVSVRTSEYSIILNTFRNGIWEKEEKLENPFKKDEEFLLRIRANNNRFEIIANQKVLGEFDHRLPLTDITHLYIDGGLALHNVSWGDRYYAVPYQAALPGGFQPGKKLFVSGVPEKSAQRFVVELLNAKGEVALHFNPRFDQNVVVRNSKQGDQWQAEEREGKQPFHKDVGFDLIVSNEPTCFELYVNGRHFGKFAHRLDPNSITQVQINGDLELQGIHVK